MKNSPSDDKRCPICKDTGWEEYEDELGRLFSKPCKCGILEKMRLESRMRFANIPASYTDCRFKNFERGRYKDKETIEKACKTIWYWLTELEKAEQKGIGLYIYSHTKGSGKTRMAASIANELVVEKKILTKFATSLQILDEIKATWKSASDEYTSERQLLDDLQTCRVLIIDDFGTESIKDWVEERFYSIINYRYVNHHVTIFTSNMAINELKYNDRITNRLLEMCFEVPFPEESIRKQIAENRTIESMFKS